MSIRVRLGTLVTTVWLLVLSCAKDDLAASHNLWNTVICTLLNMSHMFITLENSLPYGIHEYLCSIRSIIYALLWLWIPSLASLTIDCDAWPRYLVSVTG